MYYIWRGYANINEYSEYIKFDIWIRKEIWEKSMENELGNLTESSLYRRRKKLDEPSIKNWIKGLYVNISYYMNSNKEYSRDY